MADPDVAADFGRLNEVDRERSEIEELALAYRRYEAVERQLGESRALMEEGDEEPRALAELEVEELVAQETALDQQMMALLLPKDPYDEKNVIMEIRPAPAAKRPVSLPPSLPHVLTLGRGTPV